MRGFGAPGADPGHGLPASPGRQNVRVRVAHGAALAVCALALGAPLASASHSPGSGDASTGEIVEGYRLFQQYFCGDCHSLRAAGPAAYGQLAMNFNRIHAPYAVAVAVITAGLPAAYPMFPTLMPVYGRVLSSSQIRDLAAFVARYSGGYTTCAACAATSTSP